LDFTPSGYFAAFLQHCPTVPGVETELMHIPSERTILLTMPNDQVLQKSMLFIAAIGLIATISALFTMVLEFPVFWRTSWLAISIAFVVLMFVGVFAFCFAANGMTEQR
jgi:hypothetical protein